MNRSNPHDAIAKGISLVEYGAFGALLVLVAFGGLQLLGSETSLLLGGSQRSLDSQSTLSVLSPIESPSGNRQAAGSPYSLNMNPITGQPTIGISNGANSYTKNMTSIEGTQIDTVGSLILGKQLQALADAQTDPEAQSYYGEMARLAYYMGAAEGELDNIPELDQDSDNYTDGDALQEVYNKQAELKQLLNNPPPNLNVSMADQQTVQALASKVYEIANAYSTSMSRFIQNGKVTTHFDMGNNESGDGTPGNIYKNAANLKPKKNVPLLHTTYESQATYTEIKALADTVIANHSATQTVDTTLKNAKKIDQNATTKRSKKPGPA